MAEKVDLATAMERTLVDFFKSLNTPPLPGEIGAGEEPLGAQLSECRDGWPDPEEPMVYPTLAVHSPIDGDRESRAPVLYQDIPGTTVSYSTGYVEKPLVIDFFCKSRQERGRICRAFELAMMNQVATDGSTQLRLPAPGYYSDPSCLIAYRRQGNIVYRDLPGRVGRKEWQATTTVIASAVELAEIDDSNGDVNRFKQIDLELNGYRRTIFKV